MATGMRQKKLGFNFLALYDNTQTQKVSSKSVTMCAELWLMVTENGYYRKNSKIWDTSTIAIIVLKIEKFDVTLH